MARPMILDAASNNFIEGARAWIRGIGRQDIVAFDRVLALSPGYYPATLYDAWSGELARRGLQAESHAHERDAESDALPVPHPLDFDWRFTPGTVERLIQRIPDLTNAEDRVVFLGAPTLFTAAAELVPDRRFLLIDADVAKVHALQRRYGSSSAAVCRIGADALPPVRDASLLILDPPWYPEVTADFLSASASMAADRATVLLSQPALATRPDVAQERIEIAAAVLRLGLQLRSIDEAGVRYQTPHFERMSLGFSNPGLHIPSDWRVGALLELAMDAAARKAAYAPRVASVTEKWIESRFGPVRLRLRESTGGDIELIAPGVDRLPFVSRRDPLRSRVGLWTSGNRVRTLHRLAPVAAFVAACDIELRNMTFNHTIARELAARMVLDARVADRLEDLLLVEYQEHVAAGFGVVV